MIVTDQSMPVNERFFLEACGIFDEFHSGTIGRLVEWSVWLKSSRVSRMTIAIESVEKAVAHMQFQDDVLAQQIIIRHYVNRLDANTITKQLEITDQALREGYRRALTLLSVEIDKWDRILRARKDRRISRRC